MTDVIVALRVEDLTSDVESVATGGWFRIRPSVAYTASGETIYPAWPDPIPLVGLPVPVKLDPLASIPYEMEAEIPDGDSGMLKIHEFRMVTAAGSPVNWGTFTQVAGPTGSALPADLIDARLDALESSVGGISGGASNLASITDMSAFMRTVNDDANAAAARTTLGAAATAHTHVATTDLTATGTKNNTTYLRGDNTWATPAGVDISGKADTTTVNAALALKVDTASVGAVSGVAPLTAGQRLPAANLTVAVPLEIYYTGGAWPARTTVSPPAGAVVHWYGPNATPPALTGSPGMANGDHFHGTT